MLMLPQKRYSVIYADPPWSYGDKGFGKRPGDGTIKGSFAPEAGRYGTMPLIEIMLIRLPHTNGETY